MDFLVRMEVRLTGSEDISALLQQEAQRARELAASGIMRRLWRIPGKRANWGIWTCNSADDLHAAIASLPLYPYMEVTVHPLAEHPNDPGLPLLPSSKSQ